jgi:protein SSD1
MGADPKYRKTASVGQTGLSNNLNTFAPGLGATIEEEGNGNFEEGEIPERYHSQPNHQSRSQSQSFIPPRFAALAAQQEQMDVGPTGRPQLAPGFMFGAGARKQRTPVVGPPINEEDVGFQFPQQQSQGGSGEFSGHDITQRKAESGEITGIMAEQVQRLIRINSSFAHFFPDCPPATN